MRLGAHKYCNIVSFDMEDAISPVNPLEDKFLVVFPNIYNIRGYFMFLNLCIWFIERIVNLQRCDSWDVIALINTTV
jgi:hypothetical protein